MQHATGRTYTYSSDCSLFRDSWAFINSTQHRQQSIPRSTDHTVSLQTGEYHMPQESTESTGLHRRDVARLEPDIGRFII